MAHLLQLLSQLFNSKEVLLKVYSEHRLELQALLVGQGVTWVSYYFIPIVSAISITITMVTGLIIFKREWIKLQNEKKEAKDKS